MKLLPWTLTLAHAGVIFYLSSRTWAGPSVFPMQDKVIHIFLYAILGALCLWSLATTTLGNRWAIFPMAATVAFLYGVSDEMHQMFVPGRDASIGDVAADAIGGILGAWIAFRVAKHIRDESE